jgi:serine O-acetyltransferase
VEGKRPEGPDADWIHLPDPVAEAIKGLASRIGALERALAEVSGQDRDDDAKVRPLRPVKGRSPAGG